MKVGTNVRMADHPTSNEISSPVGARENFALIQYGLIRQRLEEFRGASMRQLLSYYLNHTKRDGLKQSVF